MDAIQTYIQPNILDEPEMVDILKRHVLMMYGLPEDMTYFPGQLPCSLMRDDLSLLENMDYFVAEKSDGVRYLLLAMSDGMNAYSLLIDRGFRFYRTNIMFDQSLLKGAGTLFDGEIVSEPTGLKMYVHDVVFLAGSNDIALQNYHVRVQTIRDVLRFYCFPSEDGEDMFQVLPKRVYHFSDLRKLWTQDIPALAHKNDGLVFTPDALPHRGKKSKEVFKWKRPQNHTIDLQLGERLGANALDKHRMPEKFWVQTDDNYGKIWPSYILYTWDTKNPVFFCTTALSPKIWNRIGIENPDEQRGVILECAYHNDKNMWVPICVRKDKLVPNDNYTVRRTVKTIIENLTLEELMNMSDHNKAQKEAKRKRLE